MPYTQSKQFLREANNPPKVDVNTTTQTDHVLQNKLLQAVLQQVQQGDLNKAISEIDDFAAKNWMMNLGPEKATIIKNYVQFKQVKNMIQIGGYCGYSALTFAKLLPEAKIHSIEIDQKYAQISRKIQKHAGVYDRVQVHVGTISTLPEVIKNNGPYDLVFIDHKKDLYLPDFLMLQKYQVIKKGCLIIGDNIITPGSPDYLAHFKNNEQYDSVLEHTFLQYCDIPDAILFSQKIKQDPQN